MTIAKSLGMLPTIDFGTIIGTFENLNIDLIDNVSITDDTMNVPKTSVGPLVNTDSRKRKEIDLN